MTLVDTRRLAADDLHGLAGTRLRRRVMLGEFFAGAIGCMVAGLLVATRFASAEWRLVGAWLAGIGVNYLALTIHVVPLSHSNALEAELEGVDLRRKLRRYTS